MWGKLARALPTLLVKGVGLAETIITGRSQGLKKKDLVKQMVLFGIEVSEVVAEKDLLAEPEVAAAYDSAIDAVVQLQNAIEKARVARAASGTTPG